MGGKMKVIIWCKGNGKYIGPYIEWAGLRKRWKTSADHAMRYQDRETAKKALEHMHLNPKHFTLIEVANRAWEEK
jgi:hypothetical protein